MIKSRTAQVILTAALIAALGSNAQAQSKEEMHEQLATLHGQIDRIRASAQSPADRDAAIASLQTECASISDALGGDQPVDARNPRLLSCVFSSRIGRKTGPAARILRLARDAATRLGIGT